MSLFTYFHLPLRYPGKKKRTIISRMEHEKRFAVFFLFQIFNPKFTANLIKIMLARKGVHTTNNDVLNIMIIDKKCWRKASVATAIFNLEIRG